MGSWQSGTLAGKRVGILTYDTPHLKTEQVVCGLLRRGLTDMALFALPFRARPERSVLVAHRPNQFDAAPPSELARAHGLEFTRWDGGGDLGECDYYLITGAGILSPEAVRGRRIVNAHPGIIPSARGLDAFKWSIHDQIELGVTLHFIDEEVDRGDLISIVRTPVYRTDSIANLARRHYEQEIEMMIDFDAHLAGQGTGQTRDVFPEGPAHMRMPAEVEAEMIARFDAYKARYQL